MSKIIKIFFILMLLISNFGLVQAQESNPCPPGLYYQLTSYPDQGQGNNNSARTPLFNLDILNQPCFQLGQVNNYQNYFQFIFDLTIGASIALAVILFTVGAAGGILSSTNISDKIKGKERMVDAIVGLLVVLSAWLVINTINPDLVRLPIFQGIDQLPTRETSGTEPTSVNITGGSF